LIGWLNDKKQVLARARVRPYVIRMDVATILRELERAWQYALPGRESCERDAVLRELHRLQQQPSARAPTQLRLIRC
jgi:hypothetical protein